MDPRWNDFRNFHSDVGAPPSAGLQLDRIDNDKGYWPGNVRWVTPSRNCRNKRNNLLITYEGRTQTCADWAEELGIKAATIRQRKHTGKSDAEALGLAEANATSTGS
jgi:hypothetical protein